MSILSPSAMAAQESVRPRPFSGKTLAWSGLASLALGLSLFALTCGFATLWPTNVNWLMDGDAAQHWLGWQFFRQSDWWQWPLGRNLPYGLDLSSSIVFTDSIPLLALLFKPFSALLPAEFQYTGLWLLLCFSLQALCSARLLSRFIADPMTVALGSGFFCLAPFMLQRVFGHFALVGHWLLLLALYLALDNKPRTKAWALLLALSAAVHFYLTAMVLLLFGATLVKQALARPRSWHDLLLLATLPPTCLALTMWACGYFLLEAGTATAIGGFGQFRMNLLSPIDPNTIWSTLLPDQPGFPFEGEGFLFFGSGMLLLAMLQTPVLLWQARSLVRRSLWPLALVLTVALAFAVSDTISLGDRLLGHYSLPQALRFVTGTFRASGRFAWLLGYALFLAIVVSCARTYPRWLTRSLLAVLLVWQTVDMRSAFASINTTFAQRMHWSTPLTAPIWPVLGSQARALFFVPPTNSPLGWMELGRLASDHGIPINAGYFARVSPLALYAATERLTLDVLQNNLDPRKLYVFSEDSLLWHYARAQVGPQFMALAVDGFRLLAQASPDHGFDPYRLPNPGPDELQHVFVDTAATVWSFTNEGQGRHHAISGWSVAEPWGTWSSGTKAALFFQFDQPPASPLTLEMDAKAFLCATHPHQMVDVMANGQHVATLRFSLEANEATRRFVIPQHVVQKGRLYLELFIHSPRSPYSLGLSDDQRELGLGLKSLTIRPGDPVTDNAALKPSETAP